MTIKLRPETFKALVPEVAEFLRRATVASGNLLNVMPAFDVLWEAEKLLPREGPVRQRLTQYVGEFSLSVFISDQVRERVLTEKHNPEGGSEPLLRVLGVEAETYARELLLELTALPRSYTMTLPLPPNVAAFVTTLEPVRSFGSAIRLVHEAELLSAAFPKTVGMLGAFSGASSQPSGGLGGILASAALTGALGNTAQITAVLQVRVEGFVPRYGGGETADLAHSLLKSFFGLALAVGFLKEADFPKGQHRRISMSFHDGEPNGEAPLTTIPLSDAETATISGLSYGGKSLGSSSGKAATNHLIADVEAILAEPEKHQLLLRASRWLFDSYVSEDALLSFVQATVVLEILLGDKASSEEVGLSTLLANRCAYMLGASTSERNSLIKHFKTLYATRSKIVHSGKHNLTSEEKMQLRQLRLLGKRVICSEIALALEEMRREKLRAESEAKRLAAGVRQ